MLTNRSCAIAVLGLLLLGGVLYARSLGFDFVDFDDHLVLLTHPELYDEHSFLASLREIFVGHLPREEPLLIRDVSWALDARLFGFRNPLGYHLGNVVLNAGNGALLFLFLRRATRRFWLALAVAVVFIVLPVHVEAVSWVTGRKDVLSATFVLAALLAQAYEVEQATPARRWWLRFVTLLCTVFAIFAKVAALPCVLLLALHRAFHPYLAGRRSPGEAFDWSRVLRDAPPLLPHAAATVGIVLWYRGALAQFDAVEALGPAPLSAQHLSNLAAFVPLVVGSYLRSLAWPRELSAYYRWPSVETALSPNEHLASLAIAIALAAGLLYCAFRRRDLAFYAFAFFALLLPYLNVVFVDLWRADRYIYLASFAVVAIVATLLAPLVERSVGISRLALGAFALLFIAGCALQTLRHQAVWRDNESLWRYEAHLPEPSLLSIHGLAKEYTNQAERESNVTRKRELSQQARAEALRGIERERTLGRRPSGYKTSETLFLGRLHFLLGKLDRIDGASLERQIAHYQTSFRITPNRESAFTLATLYLEWAAAAPEEKREALARASFERFVQFLALTSEDPTWRQRNAAFLTNVYEHRYPFLSSAILEARQTYFR